MGTDALRWYGVFASLLLFADDRIIIAESAAGLQHGLEILNQFCTSWNMLVNTDKTEVMIFGNVNRRWLPRFTYRGQELKISDSFRYLGVTFN